MGAPGKSFQAIKASLDRFDISILKQWQSRVNDDKDSNFYCYIVGVPDFPAEPAALKAPHNLDSLLDVTLKADVAGESELAIPMSTLRGRFCFPPGGIERPRVAVKKPRKHKKDKKEKHKPQPVPGTRRAPGEAPRSESQIFKGTKKK
jgi:hypothetical protein